MTALMGSRGTSQAGQPTWWASWAVRSASLPLPSEHRWRYRQEFLAELYGMTPAEQQHHVAGILSRVWTLWVALEEPERLLTQDDTLAKPLHCRLRIHRWQRLHNPEDGWYRQCLSCGEQQGGTGGGGLDSIGY